MSRVILIDDGDTTILDPTEGPSRSETVRTLMHAWGRDQFREILRQVGLLDGDGPAATMPVIGEVVPSVVNLDKAWYEYYHVYNRNAPHYKYAADMNLETMGDTDLGEPVCSPFDGVVINCADYGGAWGKTVRVLGYEEGGEVVIWMGSHFQELRCRVGQRTYPGTEVGTIGKGPGGMYSAHLHEQIAVGEVLGPRAFVFGAPFVRPYEWYVAYGVDEALMTRLYDKDGS